jgi:hypothetical protein
MSNLTNNDVYRFSDSAIGGTVFFVRLSAVVVRGNVCPSVCLSVQ